MSEIRKCSSLTLFELNNRRSLNKLKPHSQKKLNQKDELPLVVKSKELALEGRTNNFLATAFQNGLVKAEIGGKNSQKVFRKRIKSQTKSVEKAGSLDKKGGQRVQLRPKLFSRQKLMLNSKKHLKLDGPQTLQWCVPSQGFMEIVNENKVESTEQILVSKEGVLRRTKDTFQFKSLKKFQEDLRVTKQLLEIFFFKYFKKLKIFMKWKLLERKTNKFAMTKKLSESIIFSPRNIAQLRKQGEIAQICLEKGESYLFSSSFEQWIVIENYAQQLSKEIVARLGEFKRKFFEEMVINTLYSLRREAYSTEQPRISEKIKLHESEFEQFPLRMIIQSYKIYFRRFIYHYEEMKIKMMGVILKRIKKNMQFNIKTFTDKSVTEEFFGALKQRFTLSNPSQAMDINMISTHELKTKQILISFVRKQSVDKDELKRLIREILKHLLKQMHRAMAENKKNEFTHCALILKQMLSKSVISQRELNILNSVLVSVNRYCFEQCIGALMDQLEKKTNEIESILIQNLQLVFQCTDILKLFFEKLQYTISQLSQCTIEHCMESENIIKQLAGLPQRLSLGMFIIDMKQLLAQLRTEVESIYRKIVEECLSVYTSKISSLTKKISTFNESVTDSQWKISDFIIAYRKYQKFINYSHNLMLVEFKQLHSILQSVHRTQPKNYQKQYVSLFHLDELSEKTKQKMNFFKREIPQNLKYFLNEKKVLIKQTSRDLQDVEKKMHEIVEQDEIEFDQITLKLEELQSSTVKLQESFDLIAEFEDIEATHGIMQGPFTQLQNFRRLKTEVMLLAKVFRNYKEFKEAVAKELQKKFQDFRVNNFNQWMQNQLVKIKQNIRWLRHYQKFIMNVCNFYEQQGAIIRLMQLIVQFEANQLICSFSEGSTLEPSAQYILKNLSFSEQQLLAVVAEKQFKINLKNQISSIESKMLNYMIVPLEEETGESQPELNAFLFMLKQHYAQFQNYAISTFLQQFQELILQTMNTLKDSVKLLSNYVQIKEVYDRFCRNYKIQNKSKFTNIIEERWQELKFSIRGWKLVSLLQMKSDHIDREIADLHEIIKNQNLKMQTYVSKRVEELYILQLFTSNQILSFIDDPIVFFRNFYPFLAQTEVLCVEDQYADKSIELRLSLRTNYGERFIIKHQIPPTKFSEHRRPNNSLSLAECVTSLKCLIKESMANLETLSFDELLKSLQTESPPLQAVFVNDQLSMFFDLEKSQGPNQIRQNITKQLGLIMTFYNAKNPCTAYVRHAVDCLLLSRMEFRNRLQNGDWIDQERILKYGKQKNEVLLQFFNESLLVGDELVDFFDVSYIEPLNARTIIKIYQLIVQNRCGLLFESTGLANLCARLMKNLLIVPITNTELTLHKILFISKKVSMVFYLQSKDSSAQNFALDLHRNFQTISTFVMVENERERQKNGKEKSLRPLIFQEVPSNLYSVKRHQAFYETYLRFPVELRHNFRIVELFTPSISVLVKLHFIREGMLVNDEIERRIVQSIAIFQMGQLYQRSIHTQKIFIIQIINNIASLFNQKGITNENLTQYFESIYCTTSLDSLKPQTQGLKPKPIKGKGANLFTNWSLKTEENVAFKKERFRFGQQLDNVIEQRKKLLLIGPVRCGKTEALMHYVKYRNEEYESSNKGKKSLRLHQLDTSVYELNSAYLQDQLQCILPELQSQHEVTHILLISGLDFQNPSLFESYLLLQNRFQKRCRNCRLIYEVHNVANLHPAMLISANKIFLQPSDSLSDLISQKSEEIMKKLASLQPKIKVRCHEPFVVYIKILKGLFSCLTTDSFLIPFSEFSIVRNSFLLLEGLLKAKSNRLAILCSEAASEAERIDTLRKLFAICLLWTSYFVMNFAQHKKFDESFRLSCSKEKMNLYGVNFGASLSVDSQQFDFPYLKRSKESLTPSDESSMYLESQESLQYHEFMEALEEVPNVKILLLGGKSTGKTSFMHDHIAKIAKKSKIMHSFFALHSADCLMKLSKGLKNFNVQSQKEKLQNFLSTSTKSLQKSVWYEQLANLKNKHYIIIEDVSLAYREHMLTYLVFLSQEKKFRLNKEIHEIKNICLIVELPIAERRFAVEEHFFPLYLHFDEEYMERIFSSLVEVIAKNTIFCNEMIKEVKACKHQIAAHLLSFNAEIRRLFPASPWQWTYLFSVFNVKRILINLNGRSFDTRDQFLFHVMKNAKNEFINRIKSEESKAIFMGIFQGLVSKMQKSLGYSYNEEQSYTFTKARGPLESAQMKLEKQMEFKKKYRNLRKSRTLLENLIKMETALQKEEIVIINSSYVPEVDDFLKVAASVLNYHLEEIGSIEQILHPSEDHQLLKEMKDAIIYHIPPWIAKSDLFSQIIPKVCELIKSQCDAPERKSKRRFVITYYEGCMESAERLIRQKTLLQNASLIYIQQYQESEKELYIKALFDVERQKFEASENSAQIYKKILSFYELLAKQMHTLPQNTCKYLLSFQHFLRFVQSVIGTYFQRKYELKSNSNIITATEGQLQNILNNESKWSRENQAIRLKMMELKKENTLLTKKIEELTHIISESTQNQHFAAISIQEMRNKRMEEAFRAYKAKSHQYEMIISHYFKSISRNETANLKSVFVNNSQMGRSFFEAIALLLNGDDEFSSVKKTILDINLLQKLRDLNVEEKSQQLIKLVAHKLQLSHSFIEETKASENVLNWLKNIVEFNIIQREYRVELDSFDMAFREHQRNEERKKFESNLNSLRGELSLLNAAHDRLRQEIKTTRGLEEVSEDYRRRVKFEHLFYKFHQHCQASREHIQKNVNVCLYESIYYSMTVCFLFAVGGNQEWRHTLEGLFARWCSEKENIPIESVNCDITRIFANKEKYALFDNQFNDSYKDQIKKYRIANQIYRRTSETFLANENRLRPFRRAAPKQLYQKMLYLKMLSKKNDLVVLIDHEDKYIRYFEITESQQLHLKCPTSPHFLEVYLMKVMRSNILQLTFPALFVKIDPHEWEVTLEGGKSMAGSQTRFLKIKSQIYSLPQIANLRVILVKSDSDSLHETCHRFHIIDFSYTSEDLNEIICFQLLKLEIEKHNELNVLTGVIQLDMLHDEKVFKEDMLQLEILQKIDMSVGVEIDFRDSLFQSIQSSLESWSTIFDERVEIAKQIKFVRDEVLLKYKSLIKKLLRIYEVCVQCHTAVPMITFDYISSSSAVLDHFLKTVKEAVEYSNSFEAVRPYKIEKYVLRCLTGKNLLSVYHMVLMYLKIYSLELNVANRWEVENLFHALGQETLMECFLSNDIPNYYTKLIKDIPVACPEIDFFFKSFKEYIERPTNIEHTPTDSILFNPRQLNSFIESFNVRSGLKNSKNSQDNLRSLPLFSKYFIKKILLPNKFHKQIYHKAKAWHRQTHDEEFEEAYRRGVNLYFCCLSFWIQWVEKYIRDDQVDIIWLKDQQQVHQTNNQEAKFKKTLLLIDSRQAENGKIRLEDYSLYSRRQVVVMVSQAYHRVYHQTNSAQTSHARCIDTHSFLLIFSAFDIEQEKSRSALESKVSLSHPSAISNTNLSNNTLFSSGVSLKRKLFPDERAALLFKFLENAKFNNSYATQTDLLMLKHCLNQAVALKQDDSFRRLELSLSVQFCTSQMYVNSLQMVIQNEGEDSLSNFPCFLGSLFERKEHTELKRSWLSSVRKRKKSLFDSLKGSSAVGNKVRSSLAYIQRQSRISACKNIDDKIGLPSSQESIERIDETSSEEKSSPDEKTQVIVQVTRVHFPLNKQPRTLKLRESQLSKIYSESFGLSEYFVRKNIAILSSLEKSIEEIAQIQRIYQGLIPYDQGHRLLEVIAGRKSGKVLQEKRELVLRQLECFLQVSRQRQRTSMSTAIIINDQSLKGCTELFKNRSIFKVNTIERSRCDKQMLLKCSDAVGCKDCMKLVSLIRNQIGVEKICLRIEETIYELIQDVYVRQNSEKIPSFYMCLPGNQYIHFKIYCKKILAELI